MKPEAEIRQILSDLQEAHQWAVLNRPSGGAAIRSLEKRIGLLEYILGDYDED